MLEVDFSDRRCIERRRHIARCSHRGVRYGVSEICIEPALWRCTGCGQLNCKRHRVELDDPSICNHCTNTMVRFTIRRAGRRKDQPPIIARG
jgi:hypothetical protein